MFKVVCCRIVVLGKGLRIKSCIFTRLKFHFTDHHPLRGEIKLQSYKSSDMMIEMDHHWTGVLHCVVLVKVVLHGLVLVKVTAHAEVHQRFLKHPDVFGVIVIACQNDGGKIPHQVEFECDL